MRMPRLGWRMIPNAFAALGRALVQKWKGDPVMVDVETRERRLHFCERCPFFDPETEQCAKCLCFVQAKARIETEQCPQGWW